MKNLFAAIAIILLGYIGAMLYNTAYPKENIVTGVMVYEQTVTHHLIPINDAVGSFIYTDTIPNDTILYPVAYPKMLKYIQLLNCIYPKGYGVIGDSATDFKCEECWAKIYGQANSM